jgi:hypothetical protein
MSWLFKKKAARQESYNVGQSHAAMMQNANYQPTGRSPQPSTRSPAPVPVTVKVTPRTSVSEGQPFHHSPLSRASSQSSESLNDASDADRSSFSSRESTTSHSQHLPPNLTNSGNANQSTPHSLTRTTSHSANLVASSSHLKNQQPQNQQHHWLVSPAKPFSNTRGRSELPEPAQHRSRSTSNTQPSSLTSSPNTVRHQFASLAQAAAATTGSRQLRASSGPQPQLRIPSPTAAASMRQREVELFDQLQDAHRAIADLKAMNKSVSLRGTAIWSIVIH